MEASHSDTSTIQPPPKRAVLEYEIVLKSFEEAITSGDEHATSHALQRLREYAQRHRSKFESSRRLWNHAVEALSNDVRPEVAARACQLIEVLAQKCQSCEGESFIHPAAPERVMAAMETYPLDLPLQSSCLRALLSMSGCLSCRSFRDIDTQHIVGRCNGVSVLVRAMIRLQKLTATMQFETNAHKLARLAIADTLQALHYICLMNEVNLTALASLHELKSIRASMDDVLNELTVQEHGCMLMAEMVSTAALSDQEILECVETVTNVARLQIQEKAVVWSLAQMASALLPQSAEDVPLPHVWTVLQGKTLGVVIDMMRCCQLEDDPLVKHCLDFVAVVCGRHGFQDAGMMLRARKLVMDLFHRTEDVRIKAISAQTIYILTTPSEGVEDVSIDALLCAIRSARCEKNAREKEVFCIQVFGLLLLAIVNRTMSDLNSGYIQDVHEALGYMIQYIDEGGKKRYFLDSHRGRAFKGQEVLSAIQSTAELLHNLRVINAIDTSGYTLLHKFAKLKSTECLMAFIKGCGEGLDVSIRTPDGASALDLARQGGDAYFVSLIENASDLSNARSSIKTDDLRLQEMTKFQGNNDVLSEQWKTEAYERTLAERRQQLEDMESNIKKLQRDGCCLPSRYYDDDHEGMMQSLSGEGPTIGISCSPETHKPALGSSLSTGSVTNNGSPDPTAPNPYDDRIVDVSLSAFHGAQSKFHLGETGSVWRGLFDPETNLQQKWSMMSSSSGQNNQIINDNDRQQQLWPQMSNQPPRHQPPISLYPISTDERPSVSEVIAEDDPEDDSQLLSWLSSEITGLIGTTAPTDHPELPGNFPEFVPPPPPQMAPPYETEETSGFISDANLSPFCAVGVSPYVHPSFVQSQSWCQPQTMDPRLVPQSGAPEGRSSVQPSRFWHTEENDIPSKHLWLGNLNTRLPRSVLKSVFEEYGPIEDVVTFPGRMYAFVNFINPEDAQRAAKELDNMTLPVLTGNRKLVIKFRPNRKALGRVGDLMPGVNNIEECSSNIAPSISVPVLRSDYSSSHQTSSDRVEGGHDREDSETGAPCRHLWLGNVCVRPSRTVLFSLFSRYGPVESVRVFPGKTFAFVNFYGGEHAQRAKEALDGRILTPVTGTKPLVVRFQKDGAAPAAWARMQDTYSVGHTLQSVDSAPSLAYSGGGSRGTSPGRTSLTPQGEYYPTGEAGHERISPDEFVSLNRPIKSSIQYERRPQLVTSEAEVWTEHSQGMGLSIMHSNTVTEASSIGHLTRTLSAAAIGKQRSGYPKPPPLDRSIQWGSSLNEGVQEEHGLHPSHSFGGFEGNVYQGPFLQSSTMSSPYGLEPRHSWVGPSEIQSMHQVTMNKRGATAMREGIEYDASMQLSLPQDLFIPSAPMEMDYQFDSPGFGPSSVISCDKKSIW